MLPLRDNIPARAFPFVNLALIAANVLAFLFELSLGPHLEPFLNGYALVPAHYASPGRCGIAGIGELARPLFTYMFIHGGWMHIIGNMWVLHIFGRSVEDRLGHLRYLGFYLLSGLAAAVFQLVVSWGSPVPTLGASGAIAGVMGAYFLLFPFARVVTLVPLFFWFTTIELPAFLFLGIWLWAQFYSGTLTVLAGAGRFGGVAWWAHVGGFIAGIMLLRVVFLPPRRRAAYDF